MIKDWLTKNELLCPSQLPNTQSLSVLARFSWAGYNLRVNVRRLPRQLFLASHHGGSNINKRDKINV